MKRAKWKGPVISTELYARKFENKNQAFLILKREVEITPKEKGQRVKAHTGNSFMEIEITNDMIGHKVGEFIPTREKAIFKKKK